MKKFTIGTVIVLLLVTCVALVLQTKNTLAICPDDFGDDDAGSAAYTASVNAWTNRFFDEHPDADLGDWSKARYDFWVENDCTEAMKRYKESKSKS